ncbi:hypothetical protein FRB96_000711 [Tulasnella sp. 330]|nr:hypothetical protein FRB96_000711 [Tulasnella sp. 330]
MAEVEYKPATGVYLLRNAATKTMVDLINGSFRLRTPDDTELTTENHTFYLAVGEYAVQAYEKVENESFRNQYWYTLNTGNPDLPNAYYIINIRNGEYLTRDGPDVTVSGQITDSEERKIQQWLFWEGKSQLCRIQNVASREDNVAKGFLKLAQNSAANFIPIKLDLKDEDLTQQWRIINRTRTTPEIAKLASESAPSLLKNVTGLIPPQLFLQMPNIMYQIIQGKYTDSGDIIKQGKAHFDKTQIFAFKHCVDKWANANLQVSAFQILAGLAFGQHEGAAKTAVWGLRDDDLTSIVYFDLQKGQVQNTDPKFTPNNSFF